MDRYHPNISVSNPHVRPARVRWRVSSLPCAAYLCPAERTGFLIRANDTRP